MRAADPYDVRGLLVALGKVRPDLRPVLRVARRAHSPSKLRMPRKSVARQRNARWQLRCERGHFLRTFPGYCAPCRVHVF